VAGRPAYSLTLTPRNAQTLVGSVTIAADAETGLPLSVLVRARGQEKPAWSLTFTTLSLDIPDPARFEFTPPPGATVDEPLAVDPSGTQDSRPDDPASHGATTDGTGDGAEPAVHGSGWDLVLELPAGSDGAAALADPTLSQLLTEVAGGRVLTTALLNVFVTDDGRLLVGSVTLDRLRAVAAQ